jgi:hypothetical protein
MFTLAGSGKGEDDLFESVRAAAFDALNQIFFTDSAFPRKGKHAAQYEIAPTIDAGAFDGGEVLVFFHYHQDRIITLRIAAIIAELARAAPEAHAFRALLHVLADACDQICKAVSIILIRCEQVVHESLRLARKIVDSIHT